MTAKRLSSDVSESVAATLLQIRVALVAVAVAAAAAIAAATVVVSRNSAA